MSRTGRKVAVVLIHGIGDQRPMENLRSFVSSVLGEYPRQDGRPLFWSKPDNVSGSYELRRLNAYPGSRRPPVDFYEFYWAHLMDGNSLRHSIEWLNNLLLRWPASVPSALRRLWCLTWLLGLAAAYLAYRLADWKAVSLFGAAGAIALLAVKSGFSAVTRDWIGDAARYFNPKPHNIGIRQAIRRSGVELIAKLHESGEYRRIVVVGHSLGSVIALDLLYHYWADARERHGEPDEVNQRALKAFEAALRSDQPLSVGEVRESQKSISKELRGMGVPWRITDLVTLGSPLTHLPFLVGLDEKSFAERLTQRDLPKCPPILDDGWLSYWTRYKKGDGKQRSVATLHHAACFAATRWTNIYFPHNGWFKGDPVGGPLATLFGKGIRDVEVKTRHWFGRLNHVDYWRDDPRDRDKPDCALKALRDAIALDE